MPDITMCQGEGCKRRMDCYRNTATPSGRLQSYFVVAPVKSGPGGEQTCEYFVATRDSRAAP